MRNALIPIIISILMFSIVTLVINIQIWYSARNENISGARHIVKNIDGMLDEARNASYTASILSNRKCDLDGQFALGAEAAIQPHIRTIFIIKKETVWCSSLSGNRILLKNIERLPPSKLLLVPARDTSNGLPVLVFQSKNTQSRIIVTISDRHLREVLDTPVNEVYYFLKVGDSSLGTSGDVSVKDKYESKYTSEVISEYAYKIEFNDSPFFSLHRLIFRAGGVLMFIFLLSCIFAFTLNGYLRRINSPEQALRKGIINKEIIPFYHPIVDGNDGTIKGVEVLARWKVSNGSYITPDSFISLAEKSGLIVMLTQSLMKQVVVDINEISEILPAHFHVAINFSSLHISESKFSTECAEYKDSFNRRDLNLVVEITEREPLCINKVLIQTLNDINLKGFKIALDDFGTGYSGLSYLYDLNIDYIKIDKNFISRVNSDCDSTYILDSVIEMAKKLSIDIIAEGVETKEQLNYLFFQKINLMQGFYFYKPVSFTELKHILLKDIIKNSMR